MSDISIENKSAAAGKVPPETDSLADKLVREGHFIASSTKLGLSDIGLAIKDDPKGTIAGAATSFAVGLGIGVLNGRGALARSLAQSAQSGLALAAIFDLKKNGLQIAALAGDTWSHKENLETNKLLASRSMGQLVFDGALYAGTGAVGARIGQIDPVHSSFRRVGETAMGRAMLWPSSLAENRILRQLGDYHMPTLNHTKRVGLYSDLLAKELGFSPTERLIAARAGRMHDVGKLDVPVRLLDKKGVFQPGDDVLMSRHVDGTGSRLAQIYYPERFAGIRDAAYRHHERLNGKGYPLGLKGEELGKVDRVVPVADVMDAIMMQRGHKGDLSRTPSFDDVARVLQRGRGKDFDPAVVDAVFRLKPDSLLKVTLSEPNVPKHVQDKHVESIKRWLQN